MSIGLLIQIIVFIALFGGIIFTLWYSYLMDKLVFSLVPLLLECALFTQLIFLYFSIYDNEFFLPSKRQIIMTYLQIMGLLIAVFIPVYYDQKQEREQAVSKSNLLESLLNQSTEAIAVKNIKTGYKLANSVFRELFIGREQMVKGKTDKSLFGDEIGRKMKEKEREVHKTKKPTTLEIQLPIKEDGEKWFHIILSPIELNNSIINNSSELNRNGITKIFRDVTEIINSREKARSANRKKTKFLANLSHEIRNPINSILGMISLLESTSLNERQKLYVDVCKSSSRNLEYLVNDILDLSKIEAGKLELEESTFEIHKLIYSLVEVFAREAHNKGIELIVYIDIDVPHIVIGDKNRLDQILVNLLSNAIKHTSDGCVSLTVKSNAVNQYKENIIFEVCDTGHGIPKVQQDKIFEEFYQANENSDNQTGSGLGLSITKQLLEIMNGSIELESTVDQGSKFKVEIPFQLKNDNKQNESLLRRGELPEDNISLDNKICSILGCSKPNQKLLEKYLYHWGSKISIISDYSINECSVSKLKDWLDNSHLVFVPFEIYNEIYIQNMEKISQNLLSKSIVIFDTIEVDEYFKQIDHKEIGASLIKPITRPNLAEIIHKTLFTKTRSYLSIGNYKHDVYSDTSHKYPEINNSLEEPNSRNIMNSYKILVVEDDESNRVLIQELLHDFPIEIEFADNGEMAFKKYKTGDIDLVFMDLEMPVLDGCDAAHRISEWENMNDNSDEVPIIALTAHSIKNDTDWTLNDDFDDFLSKPFDERQLMNIISKYLPVEKETQNGQIDIKGRLPESESDSKYYDRRNANYKNDPNFEGHIPEKIESILPKYLKIMKHKIMKLKTAIQNKNKRLVMSIGHSIKGSGGSYGLDRISYYGEAIEKEAENGSWEELENLFTKLKSSINYLTEKYDDK